MGLNGGPTFKHSETFSLQVLTEDQVGNGPVLECDREQWGTGKPMRMVQGPVGTFLADHAQVLLEATTHKDQEAAKRAFDAMMTMKKIDIATIESAMPARP